MFFNFKKKQPGGGKAYDYIHRDPPVLKDHTIFGRGYMIKEDGHIQKENPQLITVPDKDLFQHTLCIGASGVGKTRLIESLLEQHIRKGNNVVFIDPKGDWAAANKMIQTTLETGRIDDFTLISPFHPELSARVNPLYYYSMVEELVGIVTAGVHDAPHIASPSQWLETYSFALFCCLWLFILKSFSFIFAISFK